MDRNSHPLDSLFLVPLEGLRFLGFECVIGLCSSLIISLTSLVYLMLSQSCFSCDKFLSSWLILFSLLRFVDIPIKVAILCKIYNFTKRVNYEDRRFIIRRLMDLVRGGLYVWQARLNVVAYWVFIAGVLKLRSENQCEDAQFYQFCVSVMLSFTVRLIIGAINFKYEERKAVNRGVPEFIHFFKYGATLHDIENIKIVKVSEENIGKLRDLCAICTENYENDELVRVLPCAESHNFHQECIDRWLIQKDACPLCGVSITKMKNS